MRATLWRCSPRRRASLRSSQGPLPWRITAQMAEYVSLSAPEGVGGSLLIREVACTSTSPRNALSLNGCHLPSLYADFSYSLPLGIL